MYVTHDGYCGHAVYPCVVQRSGKLCAGAIPSTLQDSGGSGELSLSGSAASAGVDYGEAFGTNPPLSLAILLKSSHFGRSWKTKLKVVLPI